MRANLLVLLLLVSNAAFSAMHKDKVTYKHDDVELQGTIIWDDAFEDKRPGVVVFGEKWGVNDYATLRGEMFAESGYIAFVADMYGDAKNTRKTDEANSWYAEIKGNSKLIRERAELAAEELSAHKRVDRKRMATIGYSEGADAAMQLAVSGARIDAVIIAHGMPDAMTEKEARKIDSRVLILHGDADKSIAKDAISAFTQSLSKVDVDWEMDVYGGAAQSFTNPYADSYGINNMSYNLNADERAWQRIRNFLHDMFEQSAF